ncbi:hypothetical protein [Pontiella sp.]|uniref:hypothetical protein n=1 Tax=Pontiella sp. TaxID=2837462 RepID=UPI00356A9387
MMLKKAQRLNAVARRSLIVLFASAALCGCREKSVRQSGAGAEPVYTKQYRQAAETVIVSLSETNLSTSGRIRLTIDVHAPEGEDVVIPEIEDAIAPFTVEESHTEPVRFLPNGKHLHRRVWTLDPGLPGQTQFQALEILAGPETLKTDPVAVTVSSLLPENLETPEIRDIAAPIEWLPEEQARLRIRYILLAVSGLIALSVLVARMVRRPRKTQELSPQEAARQALDRLPEDELARIDEARRILLEFLDRQFQIPTAGKTTGEIIRTIPKYPLLGRRVTLVDKLTANDLVRFSNRIPEGYADSLVEYVRGFVEETMEVPCD